MSTKPKQEEVVAPQEESLEEEVLSENEGLYELKLLVTLPQKETERILEMENELMRQMGMKGILELIYRGAFKIGALDLTAAPLPPDEL